MKLSKTSILIVTLLAAGIILGPYEPRVPRAFGAAASTPTVGVWSNDCGSFDISITSCPSGFLNVGNTITVRVNVTNAAVGRINGYEFFLYYDPAFLNATGFDTVTNTIFSGTQQVVTSSLTPSGTVHLAAVCLACSNTSTNGAIVNINFKILDIGVSPITLAAGLLPSGFAQSFTELTTTTGSGLAPNTADGYFKNEPLKLGPVARFTWSPTSPKPCKRSHSTRRKAMTVMRRLGPSGMGYHCMRGILEG